MKKKASIPKTDSVAELAKFWDRHDVTEFESELEEVTEPVFVRRDAIKVHLEASDAAAVEKLALAKGISQEELVRGWVLDNLPRQDSRGHKKRNAASKPHK